MAAAVCYAGCACCCFDSSSTADATYGLPGLTIPGCCLCTNCAHSGALAAAQLLLSCRCKMRCNPCIQKHDDSRAAQKPWFSGGSCISGRLFPSCNVCEWVVPGLRDDSAGGLQHPESDTCCCCCTLYDSQQGGRRAQQLLSRCFI